MATDYYVIEKDIPLPEVEFTTKYPFKDMKVGDSFLVPYEDGGRIRVACTNMGFKYNMRFATRRMKDKSTRIWRIE